MTPTDRLRSEYSRLTERTTSTEHRLNWRLWLFINRLNKYQRLMVGDRRYSRIINWRPYLLPTYSRLICSICYNRYERLPAAHHGAIIEKLMTHYVIMARWFSVIKYGITSDGYKNLVYKRGKENMAGKPLLVRTLLLWILTSTVHKFFFLT